MHTRMDFVRLVMDVHANTNLLTPTRTVTILILAMFTAVTALPHNAVAFESRLAHSPTPRLVAHVNVTHPIGDDRAQSRFADMRTYLSPVTVTSQRRTAPVEPDSGSRVALRRKENVPAPASAGPAQLVLEGEASYYSRAGCLGCDPRMIMANGQPLDDSALTMAIGANRSHLVGHSARVTSLATGQSATVRITDTGGFYQAKYGNRVADLTIATKNAIGMAGGTGQVRVEVF